MTIAMKQPETNAVQHDAFDDVLTSWAKDLPGIDLASISLPVRISRLAALFNRGIEELVRPYGFGFGELEVLFYLLSGGKPYEKRPSDLTRGCFVTSGAITGRVDRLAKLGLVSRIPSMIDRREMVVKLTRDGEKLARRMRTITATESALNIVLAEIGQERSAAIDTEIRFISTRIEALVDEERVTHRTRRVRIT